MKKTKLLLPICALSTIIPAVATTVSCTQTQEVNVSLNKLVKHVTIDKEKATVNEDLTFKLTAEEEYALDLESLTIAIGKTILKNSWIKKITPNNAELPTEVVITLDGQDIFDDVWVYVNALNGDTKTVSFDLNDEFKHDENYPVDASPEVGMPIRKVIGEYLNQEGYDPLVMFAEDFIYSNDATNFQLNKGLTCSLSVLEFKLDDNQEDVARLSFGADFIDNGGEKNEEGRVVYSIAFQNVEMITQHCQIKTLKTPTYYLMPSFIYDAFEGEGPSKKYDDQWAIHFTMGENDFVIDCNTDIYTVAKQLHERIMTPLVKEYMSRYPNSKTPEAYDPHKVFTFYSLFVQKAEPK